MSVDVYRKALETLLSTACPFHMVYTSSIDDDPFLDENDRLGEACSSFIQRGGRLDRILLASQRSDFRTFACRRTIQRHHALGLGTFLLSSEDFPLVEDLLTSRNGFYVDLGGLIASEFSYAPNLGLFVQVLSGLAETQRLTKTTSQLLAAAKPATSHGK